MTWLNNYAITARYVCASTSRSFPSFSYLSILLSFGIDSDSRLPFFIADGIDDCAIAVEFRRFTVNERLLATCKAALALRRRGGESLEFPAAAAAADQNQWTFNKELFRWIWFIFCLIYHSVNLTLCVSSQPLFVPVWQFLWLYFGNRLGCGTAVWDLFVYFSSVYYPFDPHHLIGCHLNTNN